MPWPGRVPVPRLGCKDPRAARPIYCRESPRLHPAQAQAHAPLCLRKLYLTWHNDGEGCWNIRWAVENPDGRTLDFREATAKTYDDLQGVLNRAVNDVAATCAHCGVPSPTAP